MSDRVGISEVHITPLMERACKATLLVHKAAQLLPEDSSMRHEIERESLRFLSLLCTCSRSDQHQRLAVFECADRFCEQLKTVPLTAPSLSLLNVGRLALVYNMICKSFPLEEGEHISASASRTTAVERRNPRKPIQQTKENIAIPRPLSERQQLILHYLRNHSTAQLKELLLHFPILSEKTVRNDLLVLCENRFIERVGVAPRSFYRCTEHAESFIYDTASIAIDTEQKFAHAEVDVFA